MVWVVIGRRTKTEPVPDGLVVDHDCPSCGEHTSFHERRPSRSFRLSFLDDFDYDEQRVMACGACGTLFATEEHGPPSRESAEGWREALGGVSDAARRAGQAIGPALSSATENAREALDGASENLGPMAKRASENAREIFAEAGEQIGPLAKRASEGIGQAIGRLEEELRRLGGDGFDDDHEDEEPDEDIPESERETDPEKAALLRRFEELERKRAEADGEDGGEP